MPGLRRNASSKARMLEAAAEREMELVDGKKPSTSEMLNRRELTARLLADMLSCHIPPTRMVAARMVLSGRLTMDEYEAGGR